MIHSYYYESNQIHEQDEFNRSHNTEKNNDYAMLVGFERSIPTKGHRELKNIPVGIDEEGRIVSLDFENEKHATFLCGASGSGKTTMLRTLIASVVNQYHPDDVEIWLVDYASAFGSYIKHLPPHIRYLLMDTAPKQTFDFLDRLYDVMLNRQELMFKGGWMNKNQVPAETYMPSILVIVDESSFMSEMICSAPKNNIQTDYKAKLQALLVKGAALGMYFIFTSQGFTEGTKGLTAFSKRQIQQRIAMKSQCEEIKQTLDLHIPSDWDNEQMETLSCAPHYALLKVLETPQGNHLRCMHVLHISDYTKQEEHIDMLRDALTPVENYDPNDDATYVDKSPYIYQ